jgi:hypothetical protein
MAIRASHATTRSERYALGPGRDLPVARIVAFLLLILPLAAFLIATSMARSGPSEGALQLANFDPQKALTESTPHFLPKPVAALPPETGAGPPPPAAEPAPADSAAELVKVANTGGVGAILRAEPRTGRQVANLRDGVTLAVLEQQDLPDGAWLRVRTGDGVEGWIYSRLVGPAQ